MRLTTHGPDAGRVRLDSQSKGNWMHLTIAPLVEERLGSEQPLPGTAQKRRALGSVVGTPGGTGLPYDDTTEPGE